MQSENWNHQWKNHALEWKSPTDVWPVSSGSHAGSNRIKQTVKCPSLLFGLTEVLKRETGNDCIKPKYVCDPIFCPDKTSVPLLNWESEHKFAGESCFHFFPHKMCDHKHILAWYSFTVFLQWKETATCRENKQNKKVVMHVDSQPVRQTDGHNDHLTGW